MVFYFFSRLYFRVLINGQGIFPIDVTLATLKTAFMNPYHPEALSMVPVIVGGLLVMNLIGYPYPVSLL